MRLQRKLKKRIIKSFGRGTYKAIVDGYLSIEKYHNNYGCITEYTDKSLVKFYHAKQFNPYLNFPKIYNQC